MRKAHWGECFDSDLNEGRLAGGPRRASSEPDVDTEQKTIFRKNLSSGCCGYEDGPGGCGLFSLTVGVYEDTMEVVCMRSEREKLHFMDFKQRIPVPAPSLNVSSGCEEMGEQENTEITKFKKLKTTKNKSTKVTETKKLII